MQETTVRRNTNRGDFQRLDPEIKCPRLAPARECLFRLVKSNGEPRNGSIEQWYILALPVRTERLIGSAESTQ